MTTYNELAGLRVNYLGSDPTLNTGNEGQVWYNSTTGTLRALVQLKAWSSAGNMNTARAGLAGAGTQTAGLGFGGGYLQLQLKCNRRIFRIHLGKWWKFRNS
jgi:hypothetical protein